MIEKIINIIYPPRCPVCEHVLKKGQMICRDCESKITILTEPKCQKCGKSLSSDEKLYCTDCLETEHFFERGVAVFEYSNDMRESVCRFKYGNIREYADYYALTAARIYGELIKKWNIDVIVPVPIHKKRQRKRGYNQSLVFAKKLSKQIGLPVETKLLIRRKNTTRQKALTREMRYLNLKNAFAIDTQKMRGVKNILLVDDIYTTGSTVDACSRIMKKAGASHVYVLCICSGKDCA